MPYTLSHGQTYSYLLDGNGFHIARSLDDPNSLQEIANKLNRLEALERSHAELVEALRSSTNHLLLLYPNAIEQDGDPMVKNCVAVLSRAQSLTSTNKTPTAGV